MPNYRVWDVSGHVCFLSADSIDAAAQEYVDGGDWPYTTETVHHQIWVDGEGPESPVTTIVSVDPDEPPCEGTPAEDDPADMWRQDTGPYGRPVHVRTAGHDWRETGVRGNGGGVIVRERCAHCGMVQITNTWAQCPSNGVQGLRSVSYEHADPYLGIDPRE